MLQNHSSLFFWKSTKYTEGVVTTFVKRNQVASPYGIVMNHKTNCFYVTTHTGHSIMKITSSGIPPSHFFSLFLEMVLIHSQELPVFSQAMDNSETRTELAQMPDWAVLLELQSISRLGTFLYVTVRTI